jgi:hypothetical protein
MLFAADSCQAVVMPMMSNKAEEQAKQGEEAQAPIEPNGEAEAQAVAEAEAVIKGKKKAKRSRKREPVAVA